jgi:hypothetical protein
VFGLVPFANDKIMPATGGRTVQLFLARTICEAAALASSIDRRCIEVPLSVDGRHSVTRVKAARQTPAKVAQRLATGSRDCT